MQLRRLVLYSVAIGVAIAVGVRVNLYMQKQRRDALPYGKYTMPQILKRSSPICTAIAQDPDGIRLVGVRLRGGTQGKPPSRLWAVDAYAMRGGFRSHLLWNAENGELLIASRFSPARGNENRHPMPKDYAKRVTGSCIATLGIAGLDSGWRVEDADLSGNSWRITWRASAHRYRVAVDAANGNLLFADSLSINGSPIEAARSSYAPTAWYMRRQK